MFLGKYKKEYHGYLYAVLGQIAIIVMLIFVKFLEGVSIATIVFFRFFIGLLCISPWLRKEHIDFSWKRLPMHLMRDLSGLSAIVCFYYVIRQIPLANAITLSNTSPLFIPLVWLIFFKLLVPKRRILGLLIGFFGVLIILRPASNFSEWVNLIGLANGLFAAIAYVYIRQLSKIETTHAILLHYFLMASILSLIPTIIWWTPIERPIYWFYLFCVGIFGIIFQYCMTKSFTYAPATKASLFSYLGVIFGGISGWLIWNEAPELWDCLGFVLIVIGGVVTLFDKSQSRWLGNRPPL